VNIREHYFREIALDKRLCRQPLLPRKRAECDSGSVSSSSKLRSVEYVFHATSLARLSPILLTALVGQISRMPCMKILRHGRPQCRVDRIVNLYICPF
jgi:hypothetical protein